MTVYQNIQHLLLQLRFLKRQRSVLPKPLYMTQLSLLREELNYLAFIEPQSEYHKQTNQTKKTA